jgi:hypothetical protein
VSAGRGIPLTARQRDYLATYPDEVMVYVQEHHPQKGVKIYANSEYSDAHRQLWIPTDGFMGQPLVTLNEDTHDLDSMPEVPHPTNDK